VTKSLGGDRVEAWGRPSTARSLYLFSAGIFFRSSALAGFLLSDYVYLVPRILLPMKDSMILSPRTGPPCGKSRGEDALFLSFDD